MSLRKGQTYHTVIYDGSDHHLLALLDGRDGEALKEWLKEHPKVSVVARDKKRAAGRFKRYEQIMKMRKDWDDGKYDSKSSPRTGLWNVSRQRLAVPEYAGSVHSLINHIKAIALNNFKIRLNIGFPNKCGYPKGTVIIKRSDEVI